MRLTGETLKTYLRSIERRYRSYKKETDIINDALGTVYRRMQESENNYHRVAETDVLVSTRPEDIASYCFERFSTEMFDIRTDFMAELNVVGILFLLVNNNQYFSF